MAEGAAEAYLLDNYGQCTSKPCRCLPPHGVWLGRLCPHFVTWGCRTLADLGRRMNSVHNGANKTPPASDSR